MTEIELYEQQIIEAFEPLKMGDAVWVVVDGKKVRRHVICVYPRISGFYASAASYVLSDNIVRGYDRIGSMDHSPVRYHRESLTKC